MEFFIKDQYYKLTFDLKNIPSYQTVFTLTKPYFIGLLKKKPNYINDYTATTSLEKDTEVDNIPDPDETKTLILTLHNDKPVTFYLKGGIPSGFVTKIEKTNSQEYSFDTVVDKSSSDLANAPPRPPSAPSGPGPKRSPAAPSDPGPKRSPAAPSGPPAAPSAVPFHRPPPVGRATAPDSRKVNQRSFRRSDSERHVPQIHPAAAAAAAAAAPNHDSDFAIDTDLSTFINTYSFNPPDMDTSRRLILKKFIYQSSIQSFETSTPFGVIIHLLDTIIKDVDVDENIKYKLTPFLAEAITKKREQSSIRQLAAPINTPAVVAAVVASPAADAKRAAPVDTPAAETRKLQIRKEQYSPYDNTIKWLKIEYPTLTVLIDYMTARKNVTSLNGFDITQVVNQIDTILVQDILPEYRTILETTKQFAKSVVALKRDTLEQSPSGQRRVVDALQKIKDDGAGNRSNPRNSRVRYQGQGLSLDDSSIASRDDGSMASLGGKTNKKRQKRRITRKRG